MTDSSDDRGLAFANLSLTPQRIQPRAEPYDNSLASPITDTPQTSAPLRRKPTADSVPSANKPS